MNELRDRALKALRKPAKYGPDLNLDKFEVDKPVVGGELPREVASNVEKAFTRVGLSTTSPLGYLQVNEEAYYSAFQKVFSKYGVKVYPLKIALEKFSLARELAWSLIPPDTDKYTAKAFLEGGELGYFVYVPPGVNLPIPVYTCLVLTSEKKVQYTHNVVYVDRGSVAHVVTGCSVPHGLKGGLHIGISEFFVGENAKLTFSMLHAWSSGVHVRPRTAVKVKEGGEYLSYYVIYSPVASLQSYPIVYLNGRASTQMVSIVAGEGKGIYDVGGKAVLEGVESSAEIISRVMAKDNSIIYSRSEIEALEEDSRGHIECLGLLLNENANIKTIPVLSSKVPGAQLTHEAAIGMIADKQIEYLMSKGFSEEEARALILKGFISVEAPKIPRTVKREIDRLVKIIVEKAVG